MRRFATGRAALGVVAAAGLLAGPRGKDLVFSIGCNDCHTPKRPGPRGPELDMERLLSGHREDANLRSIYAYLRSIPAVHNRVPAPAIAGD